MNNAKLSPTVWGVLCGALLIALSQIAGCAVFKQTKPQLPVVQGAYAQGTAELYFTWHDIPFGVLIDPKCELDTENELEQCKVLVCFDVQGYVKCVKTNPTKDQDNKPQPEEPAATSIEP